MPLVLSVLYTIPFRENMKPYIKAGGGVVFETLIMHNLNKNNIDPIFNGGLGINYFFSDRLSLKPEVNYHFIYQKYNKEAKIDGHLTTFSLGIDYRF